MNRIFFAAIIVGLILSSVSLAYSDGSGEPNDPYQIATKADLLALAETTSDYDNCFILIADINMQGQVFTRAIIAADTNSDAGFQGTAFSGVFDGDGHKIASFTVNGDGNDYLGLFGRLGNSWVKNLGIENFTVSGSDYTGGLAGLNASGRISNCYSAGDVNGISYVGGLIGSSGEIVSNCYSICDVNGTSLVGGLIGRNGDSVINCYSTSAVSGTSNVGGLIGSGGGVINSYFLLGAGPDNGYGQPLTDEQMKQQASFIGWDFLGESADGTCNYWQMPMGDYPVLSILSGYVPPQLPGSGTEQNPYIITDANDLGTVWYRPLACYILANDINLSGITWSMPVVPDFYGVFDGNSLNVEDLFINGAGYLGLFGETYPGSRIKNLGIEDCNISGIDYYVGALVGYNNDCNISNCYSVGTVSGARYVGMLVGYNYYGNISNCDSAGVVSGTLSSVGGMVGLNHEGSISNCSSAMTVSSNSSYTGGLVGYNFGGISRCSSTGTVNGSIDVGGLVGFGEYDDISSCCSTVAVSCYGRYAGGLVGTSHVSSIIDCYSTGAVNGNLSPGGLVGQNIGSDISHCYSTGSVSGTQDVGGFAGRNDGVINNCYFLVTSGPDNGFGQPLTDEQMKQRASFYNWDFTTVWAICEETNYPRLIWQIPVADWLCPDGVDFTDFAVLANAWLSNPAQANWDTRCDIAEPSDDIIDVLDLATFAQNWLLQTSWH